TSGTPSGGITVTAANSFSKSVRALISLFALNAERKRILRRAITKPRRGITRTNPHPDRTITATTPQQQQQKEQQQEKQFQKPAGVLTPRAHRSKDNAMTTTDGGSRNHLEN